MNLVDLFGFVGLIFSLANMISPLPSFYVGVFKKEIKNITLEYLIIGCIKSSLWLVYGLKLNDFYTSLSNICCISLFIMYTNMYLYIKSRMNMSIIYIFSIIIFLINLNYFLTGRVALIAASLLSVLWQFSMIRLTRLALEQKDASFINLQIALVSFLSAFVWFIYCILTENYIMMIPTIFSVIICGFDLLIYLWANMYINDENIMIKISYLIFIIKEKNKFLHNKTLPSCNYTKEPLIMNLQTSFVSKSQSQSNYF